MRNELHTELFCLNDNLLNQLCFFQLDSAVNCPAIIPSLSRHESKQIKLSISAAPIISVNLIMILCNCLSVIWTRSGLNLCGNLKINRENTKRRNHKQFTVWSLNIVEFNFGHHRHHSLRRTQQTKYRSVEINHQLNWKLYSICYLIYWLGSTWFDPIQTFSYHHIEFV